MKTILTILLLTITIYSKAQVVRDTIQKSINLDEVVKSVNKTEEMKRQVASQILVINSKQIQFDNPQTSADLLTNTGQIMVQKSQQGGGSPIIRGFEASRVLMVIDGVRMNNLIYRSGHLQNIITVDPSLLQKVEVYFGPSSTVYGSDALGGTIHFMTKKPELSPEGNKPLTLNFVQRFSSVNNASTTHFNFNLGGKKFASLTGITYNSFGDLKMGKRINPFYDSTYGLRPWYAARINGKDSMLTNSDKHSQTPSAYKQFDLLQKFLFKQNAHIEHQLNIQYSNSSDIPRYDRLTELRGGKPKFSDWYYGPQTRFMSAYDLNVKNKFKFDNIHLGLSYQKIQESRITRNFGSNNINSRVEDVGVFGYNLDFLKYIKKHKIRFGFDGQANNLKSTATKTNLVNEVVSPLDTRYPNGDNTLNHNALYFTHTVAIGKKFVLNDGLRFGQSVLKSSIANNSFFNLPVTSVEQKNLTYSGYAGLIYNPINTVKLSYLLSSGYRVPNIDDLSKIFETSNGIVIVPNPDLEPEQTVSNEIGLSFKPHKSVRIETSFYYTLFNNAITTGPSALNGQDSVEYDGKMSKVYANNNAGTAVIYGYSLAVNANISKNSQLFANFTYTKGEVTTASTNQPLDHIAPITGNVGYILSVKNFNLEAASIFNGKKDIKNYSNSGEDNLQYATEEGMPAWMTFNLRLGYNFPKNFKLQGGIENLLDTQYRVFASGINSPGRNFYLALRLNY